MTLENIVYACYEEHKKHTSNWQHGKPQKAYYDLEGLKIFYIFPKTLLIRLAVKRSKGSIL